MDQITYFLKSLSDTNRLRILVLLSERTLCVCELAYVLGVSQPSVSRHLKKMKESGLVSDEQDGFWTNYTLNKNKGYARSIVDSLKKWLKNDPLIQADLKKLGTADRTKLC